MSSSSLQEQSSAGQLLARPGAWVDLGLTLPIFLIYQIAVVFIGVQNATDMVTGQLLRLTSGDREVYLIATFAIGAAFAVAFMLLGRGQAFQPRKFMQIAIEGIVYAVVMRLAASYLVGRILAGTIKDQGRFVGFIMSLGAGFYEELAFRVLLFGLGAKILVWLFAREQVVLTGTSEVFAGAASARTPGTPSTTTRTSKAGAAMIMLAWAIVCAMIFSGVHYIGPMGDTFDMASFLFRAMLGLALTLIYVTRGFAAAVWTHAVYDVWVLVF
ncbi:MAG: CPBP family glutamic-type intramembrane protease [Polyangiaceae bacterium]|nr:CPBP family glutamic-type intramembrane protease [Polyangiaceae bacterium]